MKNENSIAHTKWECKYHIVFIPKYRKKILYEVIWGVFSWLIQATRKQN